MNRTPTLRPVSPPVSTLDAERPLAVLERVGRALAAEELLSPELRRFLRTRDARWLAEAADEGRALASRRERISVFSSAELELRLDAIEAGMLRAALAIGCEPLAIREACARA